jgi:hypothetical protein
MVKLIIIASVLLLLSCHSEVPDFPDNPDLPDKVQYCQYEKADGTTDCRSLYFISEEECAFAEGSVVESCE